MIKSLFSRVFLVVFILIVAFAFVSSALAEDKYFFRIDDEVDHLITNGVTVTFHCTGVTGTNEGLVTDNTASESVQALDGIVKVASLSAELGASEGNCAAGETIWATASYSGWITRSWSDTVSATGANVTFTTGTSLSYSLKVSDITEELGNALTLDGSTASASYSGTTSSISYGGGARYFAATTTGTITAGGNGYVNSTVAVSSLSTTAQKTVDFSTSVDSDYDGTPLSFGNVVRVYKNGGTFAGNPITSGTVTEGTAGGTTCTAGTGSNAAKWYCAVPLANTATTATYSGTGYDTTTGTYIDRTTGTDAQTTIDITPAGAACNCGDGGGGGSVESPTPTPTTGGTPTPSPTIEIVATATPTPTSTPGSNVVNGEQGSVIGSSFLSVVNFKRMLRLGSKGADVMSLQQYLAATGYFIRPAGFTTVFGSMTRRAVIAWQKTNHVSPAIGNFGPKSIAKYRQLMGI